MKNVVKTIIAAACGILMLSANASATLVESKAECKNNRCEDFQVGMYRIKNTVTMNVLLEKGKGQRVSLRLLDQRGNVIHEESLGKSISKYGRKFNFQNMEDGDYVLEISDDNEKIVKNIHLKTNEVTEIAPRTLVAKN